MKKRSHTTTHPKSVKKEESNNRSSKYLRAPKPKAPHATDDNIMKKQVKSAHNNPQQPNLKMIYYSQAVHSGHLDFYQYHDDKQHRSMLVYQGKNPQNKPSRIKNQKKKSKTKKTHKYKESHTQPDDFILYADSFYSAKTNTERHIYKDYVQRFRKAGIEADQEAGIKKKKNKFIENERRGFLQQGNYRNTKQHMMIDAMTTKNQEKNPNQEKKSNSTNDIDQFLKGLSVSEKEKIFKELERQFESTSVTAANFYQQKQVDNQQLKLSKSLGVLQSELMHRHQRQQQRIQEMYRSGQISKSEFENKKCLLANIRKQKQKVLDCTKQIFSGLLENNRDQLQTIKAHQNQEVNVSGYYKKLQDAVNKIESNLKDLQGEQRMVNVRVPEKKVNEQKNLGVLTKKSDKYILNQKIADNSLNEESFEENFGKSKDLDLQKLTNPHQNPYFEINLNDHSENQPHQPDYGHHQKKLSNGDDMLLITPDKGQEPAQKSFTPELPSLHLPLLPKFQKNQEEDQSDCSFSAKQDLSKTIKIPLLITKQKVEELQFQYQNRISQKLKMQLDRKISFQMSEFEYDEENSDNHFTTLADINGFIVGLYEYVIRHDLDKTVERLNLPYGKSVRDKLYILQNDGGVDEQLQFYTVLDQEHFHMFNKQISDSGIKLRQEEKMHNNAVFDAFNFHLNAYRPYFDLEGEVYPWQVSEKGITFYEISEENIEQVFEKTKVKVLQFCSMLCGVQLRQDEDILFMREQSNNNKMNNNFIKEILNQKNDEQCFKEEKASLLQEYNKWDTNILDTETNLRILLGNAVIDEILKDAVYQISEVHRKS